MKGGKKKNDKKKEKRIANRAIKCFFFLPPQACSEDKGMIFTPSAVLQPWPWVLTDPLDDALDGLLAHKRKPALFPPLLEPKGCKRRREDEPAAGPLVENEPGLCARMEATHAALLRAIGPGGTCCAAWRLDCVTANSGAIAEPTEPTEAAAAPLPPLAEPAMGASQRYARPLRRVEASAVLRPPMLYSLVHNHATHEVSVEALGAQWLLPPQVRLYR